MKLHGLKGYKQSEEHIKKRTKVHKGAKRSEETKKKQREAWKRRKADTVEWMKERERRSRAHKEKNVWNNGRIGVYTLETLEKMSAAKRGKELSEEHKRKISNGLKIRYLIS